MPPFNWTGTLRPTMVSPRREVTLHLLVQLFRQHAALCGCALPAACLCRFLSQQGPAYTCRYQMVSLGQTMQRQGYPRAR